MGLSSYLPICLKVRKTLNTCEFRAKDLTTKCEGIFEILKQLNSEHIFSYMSFLTSYERWYPP